MVRSVKNNIPNALTCCNLFCGCMAIYYISLGLFGQAFYLVVVAGVFDFLDGFIARILNAHSAIGKQLDSLADMVTFGVVPGYLLFSMIDVVAQQEVGEFIIPVNLLKYLGFVVTIFSAIRLAKFNIDTRQQTGFIGLPTPANSLFISSLGVFFLVGENGFFHQLVHNIYNLILISLICSALLVANIPMIALKFSSFKWKGNEFRYLLIIGSGALIVLFQLKAVPLILILYIISSLLQSNLIKQKK